MLNSEVLSTIENYFNECDLHLASLSNLEFENAMFEMDIDFGSGASKGVFTNILDNEVVKIPFTYNEDDEIRNDCDLEFEIYEKAARAGLSQYFASLRIVGSIEDVTVYAQEFCEPDDFYESSIENIKKAEDIGSNLFNSEDALAWAGEFIETYGESEFVRLCNFLDKKGVNDLHSGNIGRRMNGQLCLIDFSGYYG